MKDHFRNRGIRVTSTAGYEPNANPRAEGGINLVKNRARTLLMNMGPEGPELWPLAIQRACWCLRSGSCDPRVAVPAFGVPVTVKIKKVPTNSFAPRGKDMLFLGTIDNEITHGIFVGGWNGDGWNLDASGSFVVHQKIGDQVEHFHIGDEGKNQEEFNQEEHNDEKPTGDDLHHDAHHADGLNVDPFEFAPER